jgi:enolase-phosphatase E1
VPSGNWNHIRVLLLDIEGTTTPVDFVYKTLFPYAASNVEPFLRTHFSEPEIKALVQDLKAQHERDNTEGQQPTAWLSGSDEEQLSSCVAYARWLIARDSKCTPLKTLQGKIWQQGFANGELHGEVYPDVPPAFERWRQQQRQICIYSSGSVLAQQQLFQSVLSGDLTPYIAAYFDTHTGIKTAAASYTKIATSLGRSPREFLFVSDAPKEVQAAHSAEMQAVLCDRSAPASAQPSPGETIHTFDEIFPADCR